MTTRRSSGHGGIVVAVVLLLGAVAVEARAGEVALTPLAGRLSDSVVSHDLALLDGLQRDLGAPAPQAGARWPQALASAWLAVAREAYLANDETGFAARALGEAQAVLGTPMPDTLSLPAFAGSTALAPAQVAELERLKAERGHRCAEALLAQAEVALHQAEHEAAAYGTCASAAGLAHADQLLAQAAARIAECAPPPAPAPPAPPAALAVSVSVPQPALQLPTQEELRIPRDVYFALARHDVSPASRQVIEGIAALMSRYPSIQVHLVGHTDSRASAAYNLRLSERRVNAVREVLLQLGVAAERITAEWKGKSERAAVEDSRRGFALNRRVDMRFSDAEGRTIEAEHQEQDLQLEPDEPARPRH